jgi:AhpD family alkylhydroperoxidase
MPNAMTDPHPTSPLPPPLPLDVLTPDALDVLAQLASSTTTKAIAAGLDPRLLELVSLRASQLNGCRFCIDLHTRLALAAGEREERLTELAIWSSSPLFSESERAVLALCEAVTCAPEGQAPDALRRAAGSGFDDNQLASLLWVITIINTYNRLATASGMG